MKKLLIYKNKTLAYSMRKLSVSGEKCLIVVDKKRKLLGTLSDGDLRKSLLKNYKLNDSIEKIYKKNPFKLEKNKFDIFEARKILVEKRLEVIPVVDKTNKIIDIVLHKSSAINLSSFYKNKIEGSVVIMAGGRGKRLRPFTNKLPKPLIQINGKTLIEHVLDNFIKWGFDSFKVTINYKSNILKKFLQELNSQCNFTFVKESKPLGTGGSLFYLKKKFKKHFIVSNCDTVAEIDLNKILKKHFAEKNLITMVCVKKNITIPYGVCKTNQKMKLKSIEEKPVIKSFINAGIYICHPKVLDLMRKAEPRDMVDIIIEANLIKKNSIGIYEINEELWQDMGKWSDFERFEANY
jgi:hypothetical protein